MSSRLKALTLLLLLAVVALAASQLPVRQSLLTSVAWIDAHREIAWAGYIGGYVLAAVLLVPGSILTLGAGFVFGLPVGIAVVSAGSTLGACCAFLIGRFLARGWAAARVAALPRLHLLDRIARRNGFTLVLLIRLSPLFPFNLINYGLGLTGVKFRDYLLASWLGMLPATVVYVYVGSLAKNVTELGSGTGGGAAERVLLVVGLAAAIGLAALLAGMAKQMLKTRLETDAPPDHGINRHAETMGQSGMQTEQTWLQVIGSWLKSRR